MSKSVALLRGINVGGRTSMPMAELRALCQTLGWSAVETYIQSGNVIFEASDQPEALEAKLEEAVERHFGIAVPVLVRSRSQWSAYAAANPFLDAAQDEPNRLMLSMSKRPLAPDAAAAIRERARDGEQVAEAAGALWIHYPAGAGSSRLSPSLLDRLAGSHVTARNWRTVLKLEQMLAT